ncbi:MAG: cupin domain-containing protein [Deltaproteobacteria bacterium]|nr:cupin domain-containing protein [Deltaproteobacteria bacterium]
MKVFKYRDVKAENVTEGVEGHVRIRWLINKGTGAENFAMRMFEVEPGTKAGPHSHSGEHEVFILEGKGVMKGREEEFPIAPGSVVFIPSHEPHQLSNPGPEVMRYLCMIPIVQEE